MKLLKTTTLLAAVVATVMFAAAPASAIVDYAPDYRGDPNSVHAVFDFQGDEIWNNWLFEPEDGGYPLYDLDPRAQSLDSSFTSLQLPNFIDQLEVKHMRIQMLFQAEVLGEELAESIVVGEIGAVGADWEITGFSTGLSAIHYVDIDIWPNPDFEVVDIHHGDVGISVGVLYRIEVDTVSVPEPMTMSMLAIGGLAMLRRKRK